MYIYVCIHTFTYTDSIYVHMYTDIYTCLYIYKIIEFSPMPWQMLFAKRYDNSFQISTTDILYLFLTMLLIPCENNEKTIL